MHRGNWLIWSREGGGGDGSSKVVGEKRVSRSVLKKKKPSVVHASQCLLSVHASYQQLLQHISRRLHPDLCTPSLFSPLPPSPPLHTASPRHSHHRYPTSFYPSVRQLVRGLDRELHLPAGTEQRAETPASSRVTHRVVCYHTQGPSHLRQLTWLVGGPVRLAQRGRHCRLHLFVWQVSNVRAYYEGL